MLCSYLDRDTGRKHIFRWKIHFGRNFVFNQTELGSAVICAVSAAVSRTIGILPEDDAGERSEMRLGVDTVEQV